MGEVIDIVTARRERAIARANEKVRKEEEKNRPASNGNVSKLQAALQKYGSFTGNQLKKKKEASNGDIQD